MSRKSNNSPVYKPKKRTTESVTSGSEIPPNFPQHNLPEPYAQLLNLGEKAEETVYESIAQELKQGDDHVAVAKLLEMAQDQTYYDYVNLYKTKKPWQVTDPRQWTRMHAIRVLSLLGEAAQSAIEPLLPLLIDDDDWVCEEVPFFYAEIGEPAMEPLARVLNQAEADTFLRSTAAESLVEIGEKHPELRDRVIAILDQTLMSEQDNPTVAAFVIGNLMDLGARESLPLIVQAYHEDRVDETIVQMADVEEHFELPQTTPRRFWRDDDMEVEDESEGEEYEGDGLDMDLLPIPSPRAPGLSLDGPPLTPYVAPPKVGRNEPCPCGSGKKYKKCCGA